MLPLKGSKGHLLSRFHALLIPPKVTESIFFLRVLGARSPPNLRPSLTSLEEAEVRLRRRKEELGSVTQQMQAQIPARPRLGWVSVDYRGHFPVSPSPPASRGSLDEPCGP